MSWSGGLFTREVIVAPVRSGDSIWQEDAATPLNILADRVDSHDQDLAVGINQCLNRDGSNIMLGPLDMGSFPVKNLPFHAINADAIRLGEIINNGTLVGKTLQLHSREASANNAVIQVGLTGVMDGAGTDLDFNAGTNLLTLTKQGATDDQVDLSSLSTANEGWLIEPAGVIGLLPNREYAFTFVGGQDVGVMPANPTVGAYYTMHNASLDGSLLRWDRSGNSVRFGTDIIDDDLDLSSGDTLTVVCIAANELVII